MTNPKSTLFIRLDRIGDLILTLPADQCLEQGEHDQVHWVISDGLQFIMDHSWPLRSYTTFQKNFSWQQVSALLKLIKKNRVKKAVVFHAPWWVGFALWFARVPLRVGRYSQWHSFLFFNKGLRQKRSLSEKHESEYNFDLVQLLHPESSKRSTLRLTHATTPTILEKSQLKPRGYYVVHPGMSGSALNWPTDCYIQFIKELVKKLPVVITGTKSDWSYIEPLKKSLSDCKKIYWFNEQLSGPELIGVLERARAVIAPSTGVVHIAASTKTPTLGLYSNVIPEAAHRWGPKGDNVATLSPDTPITLEKFPEVMREISVEKALGTLYSLEGDL